MNNKRQLRAGHPREKKGVAMAIDVSPVNIVGETTRHLTPFSRLQRNFLTIKESHSRIKYTLGQVNGFVFRRP